MAKCCAVYPYKQLVIHGSGNGLGTQYTVTVCTYCGTVHIEGAVCDVPLDISFVVVSEPAREAIMIGGRKE